ncbi:hypothetical protein FB45DRAFT_933655 [Roridomyces roridus]|uniref:Uncharacterized protein n=1 Tax=Roridomyces roridus TaxID=1738132 RepID=A0AAD7BCI5_9AGAR|nr:hypothetical protein FB45DRAFT_933655 [Roridomyces roridus]
MRKVMVALFSASSSAIRAAVFSPPFVVARLPLASILTPSCAKPLRPRHPPASHVRYQRPLERSFYCLFCVSETLQLSLKDEGCPLETRASQYPLHFSPAVDQTLSQGHEEPWKALLHLLQWTPARQPTHTTLGIANSSTPSSAPRRVDLPHASVAHYDLEYLPLKERPSHPECTCPFPPISPDHSDVEIVQPLTVKPRPQLSRPRHHGC